MTTPPPSSSMAPQVSGQHQESTLRKEQVPMVSSSPQPAAATVAPADHVLTLVSSSVVNQRGFANTCGVPLGAHLDLQPSAALGLPRPPHSRPPLRCNGCSAFLNVYCKTNLVKGVWKCNMCGVVNIHKELVGEATDVAAFPELSSEAVEYVAPLPPPPASRPPRAHPHHLVFAVDTSLEPRDLQAVREAVVAAVSNPSLDPTTLVSLVTFDGCVAVHNLGAQRLSHVLPTAAGGGGSDLQSAVQQLLDRHCTATAARRAVPAAGGDGGAAAAVAAAVSGGGGVLVSEAGSCGSALAKALASLRTVQGEVAVRARARCLCSAVEAALRLIAAAASLDLTQHHNLYGSRVVVMAGGPATRGPGAVPLELLDQAVSEKGRSPESRTAAAALDVGAALGTMAAKIGVPVDIFTSTSIGINARLLTAIAHGSGGELMPQHTAPHHLLHLHQQPQPSASSSASASTPISTPSTPTSFGTTHHRAAQPQSQMQQETMPGAAAAAGGGFLGTVLSRQLVAALGRRFGLEGRLDCYCSEGLRLVQWLGPLDTIQIDPPTPTSAAPGTGGGAAAAAGASAPSASSSGSGGGGGGDPYRLSSSACSVTAVECGRAASLRLEVTQDLDDVPSLLLQVVLHWSDPASRLRLVRVVTRRLAVVESRTEFLRSVNPVAAAALLGKRTSLEAKRSGAFRDFRKCEEARYAVGGQLGLVASRCGVEVQARRGVLGLGGRKSWQWPAELMPLSYALYHFQRGPLLGPPAPPPPGTHPAAAAAHLHGLWDSDARLAGLNHVLRAAWGDAYRAMSPKLYAVLPQSGGASGGGDGADAAPQLVALPCVSLAAVMARTAPLLLDVGTAVLVSPTEEPGHDGGGDADISLTPGLLAAALQAAGGGARFPPPSVVLTPGAQAGGGALAARLIPVHRDAYPEQALQHPQLQQLGAAVAAQLSKQLREGDLAAAAAAGLPAAQAKQVAGATAAAASFVEWCGGLNVLPFPAAATAATGAAMVAGAS